MSVIPGPAGTLHVGDGVVMPPDDLVAAGFAFLARGWDVAAPFTVGHILAKDIGSQEEREQTRALVFDLRVPVYDPRLLFVSDRPAGRQFLAQWEAEPGNPYLAFLRVLAALKPRFCVLPRLWLGPQAERDDLDRKSAIFQPPPPTKPISAQTLSRRALARRGVLR